MNKNVFIVIILALIALVFLYLYSFGPLAQQRLAVHPSLESLKLQRGQGNAQGMNEYINKDVKENYYSIAFPENWRVESGPVPGAYLFSFKKSKGSVELVDVPDNSTLELFILSQEEPGLKKKVTGYKRRSYQKIMNKACEIYDLKYLSTALNGIQYGNIRTYILGQDRAGVITITIPQKEYTSLTQVMNTVVKSFKWENQ